MPVDTLTDPKPAEKSAPVIAPTPVAGAEAARSVAPLTADQTLAAAAPPKPKRTLGLKLFDILLYPLLTNFAVFGLSVGATYLTARGDKMFTPGTTMDKVGRFFHARGEWMIGKLMKTGMSRGAAEMSKMVFFSFVDGTLFAPMVKLFEDRREKIGEWLDNKLGTNPDNLAAYDKEPKQTWGSVLTGRLLTALIVVPIAATLEKTPVSYLGEKISLNDRMFRIPGENLGALIEQNPKIARYFGKLDIKELSRTGIFEFFYTTVCTTGLYFISRAFAHRHDVKTGRVEDRQGYLHRPRPEGRPPPAAINDNITIPNDNEKQDADKPRTHVAQGTHFDRVNALAVPQLSS